MSAGWVAGSVRAKGLARHRLGAEGTRQLASCSSPTDALQVLAASRYGANIRSEQPLAVAQREIASSVLWDLRVLASWLPPDGLQRFVRSLWSPDRDLAYARHYPAISWSGSFSRDDAAVAAWHANAGDPGWADRRSRLAALPAEADRLSSLAELMGVAALPPRERATMLAGRLIREGLLQQSALSSADASCDTARAAALSGAVLAVAERCQQLAGAGVPPAALEELDFSPILRAREEAVTPDAVTAREQAMLAQLDELFRRSQDGGTE